MTAILHLDPSSRPLNGSGKAMPYATLTLLRAGTDEVLETYTADSEGIFGAVVPDFATYTYRVQLKDRYGVLRYDIQTYKPAYANYVDACSQRVVAGNVLSGVEFEFTASGNPVNLYADPNLTIPMANPIKSDASGLLPPIYKASGPYTMTWSGGSVEFSGNAYPEEVALSGIAVPAAAAVGASSASITTDSITISPSGGSSPYAYAWVWHSGGTGISITSSATQSTTFSAATLSLPETRSGTARCTITDQFGDTATVDVVVTISRTATPGPLDGSASPSSIYTGSSSSSITTGLIGISPTGGVSPYTYAWSWTSGGTGISIDSASAVATSLTVTGMSLPETRTGTLRCVITDAALSTKTVSISVTIIRSDGFSVIAVPDSISTPWYGIPVVTDPMTAAPAGGVEPFTYSWAMVSGGESMTIDAPDSASTTVTAGTVGSGVMQCTITDSAGFVGVSNEVSIYVYPG